MTLKLSYLVTFEIDDVEWNKLHIINTAPKLFREEIQSNLESCPEPMNVQVELTSKLTISEGE